VDIKQEENLDDYFFPGRKIGEENFRNSSFGIFFQKDLIVKI
jgi:hypothetical protein